jgi:hypothetical protein
MLPGILALARKIVDSDRDTMNPGTWLAIHGPWNHRRKAAEHIVALINCQNGRIADFEIVSWDTKLHPGNHTRAANGTECVGVERMPIRGATKRRAAGVVRDKDSKTGKVIKKSQ